MNMQITLNGKNVAIKPQISLLDVLKMQGFELERLVIEHNFEIVKKEAWGNVVLEPNDNLEVLRFVGGG